MPSQEDYTIGWISTVDTEYVTAEAFLDEKHDPTFLSPLEKTKYTLGRIGRHNVVIAIVPVDQYGLSSAARVAEDMMHSFPSICIGLMVGLGGGVPSQEHDIRLGDIVVGVSSNGRGSVLQYDFAKTIQAQKFQTTGFLGQPPTCLLAALLEHAGYYEGEGHQLDDTARKILEKEPRRRGNYQRPDIASDRLYRSQIVHPAGNESPCALSCGNDPSHLVMRPPRLEHDDNPAIHYGLIASANRLMDDASVRDKLAAQMDVLCFEMEAAGLMNPFPFLLIRGIGDYADSHKNKAWQGYAAILAAGYAKDLLSRIHPWQVQMENNSNHTETRHRVEFSGSNPGFQIGTNNGRINSSETNRPSQPNDSAFFVSSNIRGRPPVSMEGPKQGSTG